jgi:hypothetical protein
VAEEAVARAARRGVAVDETGAPALGRVQPEAEQLGADPHPAEARPHLDVDVGMVAVVGDVVPGGAAVTDQLPVAPGHPPAAVHLRGGAPVLGQGEGEGLVRVPRQQLGVDLGIQVVHLGQLGVGGRIRVECGDGDLAHAASVGLPGSARH